MMPGVLADHPAIVHLPGMQVRRAVEADLVLTY
jgi:hypothetical protein